MHGGIKRFENLEQSFLGGVHTEQRLHHKPRALVVLDIRPHFSKHSWVSKAVEKVILDLELLS